MSSQTSFYADWMYEASSLVLLSANEQRAHCIRRLTVIQMYSSANVNKVHQCFTSTFEKIVQGP
jgi:hypothetical protein